MMFSRLLALAVLALFISPIRELASQRLQPDYPKAATLRSFGVPGGMQHFVEGCAPRPARGIQMLVGGLVGAGFGYVMYYAAGGILSDSKGLDARGRRMRSQFMGAFAVVGVVGMALKPRRGC